MLTQEIKAYESRELDIVEGDAKTSFAEEWRIRSYLLDNNSRVRKFNVVLC